MGISSKWGFLPDTRTVAWSLRLWAPVYTSLGLQCLKPFCPPSRFCSLSITHRYHLCHNSPHTNTTFRIWYLNAITTFETNLYPQKYHLQVHSSVRIWTFYFQTSYSLIFTFNNGIRRSTNIWIIWVDNQA